MMPPKQDFATFFAGLVEDHKAHVRHECTKHQRRLPWLIGAIRQQIGEDGTSERVTRVVELRLLPSTTSQDSV